MRLWGKIPPLIILLALLVMGTALIFIPHFWEWTWDYGIAPEIGVAFLVAAILGLTIDRWLKAELRTDAFLAAIGHVLAPEFRAEVSRIIGYKLVCERHMLLVELEIVNANVVKVTSSVERTIKNKSAYPEALKNIIHADEWGYAEGKSTIIDCMMEIEGKTFKAATPKTDAVSTYVQTEERELKPDHTAILRTRWLEYKNINDVSSYHYSIPTVNPEIEVISPPDLDCSINFGTPS